MKLASMIPVQTKNNVITEKMKFVKPPFIFMYVSIRTKFGPIPNGIPSSVEVKGNLFFSAN